MPNDIHFFISSLPLLKPGQKPLLSHGDFLQACARNLSSQDAERIAALKLEPQSPADCGHLPAVRLWQDFETFLRNGTAQERAVRLKVQVPAPRPTVLISQYTLKQVHDAFLKDNPAERELLLDQARWQALEELGAQHQFDLEALAVYALKLLLLERMDSRQVKPGLSVFNGLVSHAVEEALQHRQQD